LALGVIPEWKRMLKIDLVPESNGRAHRAKLEGKFPVSAFERSRWRGGRFACYAPDVMLQRRAFNFDFSFPLIFLSQAKSIDCRRKKIQFP
jgi:hypothetical protein